MRSAITLLHCAAAVLILVLLAPPARAGLALEYSSSASNVSNLLGDSSKVYDAYSSENLVFRGYPFSSLEVKLSGDFSHYMDTPGLDNKGGGLAFTYLPLSENSRLSLYLTGALSGRVYRDEYNILDNNFYEASAAIGYRLLSDLNIRSGITFRSTAYLNRDIDYRKDIDIYLGGNKTFLGSGSIDIEVGYARTNYAYRDANLTGSAFLPPPFDDTLYIPYANWWMSMIPEIKDNLWVFYISPRISRSIGSCTGINVQYTQRNFQNYSGGFLPGQATDYLSPWITIWDGQSVTANIKSYLISRFVITTGAGYWDKSYLTAADDLSELGIPLRYNQSQALAKTRRDWQTRYYFGLQLPLKLGTEIVISPALNFDYTHNRSNDPLYSYENVSISTGVTVRW